MRDFSSCSPRSAAPRSSTPAQRSAGPGPVPPRTGDPPYDAEAVARFFQALVAIDPVFQRFRTGFIGKVSPVHLFWGSFDLAVTRFSGRRAPLHPGGIPALPDAVTREAYSHEVSSAGFWPGGGGTDFPAFYSYAYPAPRGFADAPAGPEGAYFDGTLGEFLLPYDAVRQSGRSGSDAAGVSREHLPGRSRSRRLGPRRTRSPARERLRPRPVASFAGWAEQREAHHLAAD